MNNTDFLTKIVLFVLVYLVLFSIVMTVVFVVVGSEPATLIQWTFTVFGVELLVTMFKKYIDKKYGKDDVNDSEIDQ